VVWTHCDPAAGLAGADRVSGGLVSVVVAGWRESAFVHGIVEFLLQYMSFWQNCLSVLRD